MQPKRSLSVTLVAPQVHLSWWLQLFLTEETWMASSSRTTLHCVTSSAEIEKAQINQVRRAAGEQFSPGLTLYLTSSEDISSPYHLPKLSRSHM